MNAHFLLQIQKEIFLEAVPYLAYNLRFYKFNRNATILNFSDPATTTEQITTAAIVFCFNKHDCV